MNIQDIQNISTSCTRTEFVGTAVLDTIGLVISGVDDSLLKEMNIGTKYHCLGLFSSRTGAAGQITAIDDAVKATNTEVLSIELPRDTKGWGESGHLEFAFSASAGPAIHKAFGTPLGEAFGFMAGSPAAIGLVMADNAVKSAAVSITKYMTPNIGTSHSNEVIIAISGDASAVKAAVLEGRQTGLELLIGMGTYPEIPGTPYL